MIDFLSPRGIPPVIAPVACLRSPSEVTGGTGRAVRPARPPPAPVRDR